VIFAILDPDPRSGSSNSN